MKPANNEMMRVALRGVPQPVRAKLIKHRTKTAMAGSERAFYRSQVPQNPVQILEIACEEATLLGISNVDYSLSRSRVQLTADGGRILIDVPVNRDVETSESQSLACMAVLRVLHELYGT